MILTFEGGKGEKEGARRDSPGGNGQSDGGKKIESGESCDAEEYPRVNGSRGPRQSILIRERESGDQS